MTRTDETPTLGRLAELRATGALFSDVGALYLADGQVVHAESSAAPPLDELLIRAGRLPAEGWQAAVARGGARGGVARALLDSGQLARGELEICHLGALFDAAYFVLAPGRGAIRFRTGAAHWLGPIRPIPAGRVDREVRRRQRLLEALWPYPAVDDAPVLPTTGAGGAAADGSRVPRRRRAVLDLADGVRTPTAIARLLGRPAFHTLVDVRRLAAAGHVRTPRAPRPEVPPQPVAAPPLPDWLPQHPAGPAGSADRAGSAGPTGAADADVELLRRLRDALEEKL